MNKKVLFVLAISILIAFSITAEPLSKIGVVNFTRIIEDYYSESSAWREIDSMRNEYQRGLNTIVNEIEQLKTQQLEAQRQNNEISALQLGERLYQRQEYMKEYHNVWSTRIDRAIANMSTSNTVTTEIYTAIRYIAETQGYSVIMRTQDPNILWYSQSIDITDLVIERLKSRR